jgi:IS5 family transposase
MRKTLHEQRPLVAPVVDHEHARELDTIKGLLDEHPEAYRMVHADLVAGGIDPGRGRDGMTAEQVLGAVLVKQLDGYSYEDLAFHLADSSSYQALCGFGIGDEPPSAKTLQRNIKKVRTETLEEINRVFLRDARDKGIEKGRTVRVDCTVEETNIHAPTDSSLLFDFVRVADRLLGQAKEMGYPVEFMDHTRRAKRRDLNVLHAKNERQRRRAYRDLLGVAEATVDYAVRALPVLVTAHATVDLRGMLAGEAVAAELEHYVLLGRQVIDQTRRRVIDGEKVPPQDKVVSIFEPHTDIVIKARRETLYGHKLCLTTGRSGLVLDCVVLEGNPADSTLPERIIGRQKDLYGRPPRQATFDGGFASKANLATLKSLGVADVVFTKGRGLSVSDMAKSTWVFKKLRRFRAGIEAGISFLKRCFGLGRCLWRGFASFKAYTWAGVLSANLLMLARHAMA